MRNNRVLVIFAMVFVVLIAVVAIQNAQPQVVVLTPTPGVTDPPVFPDMTVDNIFAIQIGSPETGKTFTISRASDGTWTAPGTAGTLNQTEASNIARTMVVLPFSETLTLAPNADKSTYGFAPDGVLTLEIVLTDGVSHAVVVGFRTPTANSYYALIDDRPDLYLLDRPPIDFLINRLKSPPVT